MDILIQGLIGWLLIDYIQNFLILIYDVTIQICIMQQKDFYFTIFIQFEYLFFI